jgi:pyruvate dehydrogenase E1 component alpha subunit
MPNEPSAHGPAFHSPADVSSAIYRVLEPDGTIAPGHERDADLKDNDLLELYRLMTLARRIDIEGANLQRQGQMALWVPLLGQEAAQVGSAYVLEPGDWAFTYGREQAVGLVRGVSASDMAHVWRGTWHGGMWDFREHGLAPFAIPIGTQVPHAVGFALGAKLDGTDRVAMAYFGDGATSSGDFHGGCTFAGVWKAPVVFLCQNNGYAISVPVAKQTAAPAIAAKAVGYGFPGVRVDGNDVLAVYAATRDAVARARRGEGPTLIEAVTYRRGPHSTADDPKRYRTDEEVAAWEAQDPIARFRTHLRTTEVLTDDIERGFADQADDEAAVMRSSIVDAPPLDARLPFEHVYDAPSQILESELRVFEREQGEGR